MCKEKEERKRGKGRQRKGKMRLNKGNNERQGKINEKVKGREMKQLLRESVCVCV